MSLEVELSVPEISLTSQFTRTCSVSLCRLNLDSQDIGLQFQDLVLDLANLQRSSGSGTGSPSSINSIIEASGSGFSIFSYLSCLADDSQVSG